MQRFRDALESDEILLFDGAMGTLLQARGLPPGQTPEEYGAAHPEAIKDFTRQYLAAGARVVTTNTFGATRYKLPKAEPAREFNRRMATLARAAAGDAAFVAGSVGPTGRFAAPLGDVSLRELAGAFREQIEGLAEGGADLIVAETHFDLAEARAVVLAAREAAPGLPVAVSMTFESATSLTGTPPEVFFETMANMGVDLIGVNCGTGPAEMEAVVRAWLPVAGLPFLVKPNAGIPVLQDGRTVFPMGPDAFAEAASAFAALGAKAVSGCCGTTPAHIEALAGRLRGKTWQRPAGDARPRIVLTSRARAVPIGPDFPAVLIGERINPTGKKALTAALQAGNPAEALRLAEEQIHMGARVLDVNVGAPMVDETALLPDIAMRVAARFETPLCLDSADAAAIEQALWVYPGSPLVNSVSGEPGRMETLGPLCARFGAPFILLPLRGKTLPESAADRIKAIEALLVKAESLGIPRRLIMADVLALTVSSRPEAARQCLETIRHCREKWGLPTVLGLSNISFGLPARDLLNAGFLSMCLCAGLAAHISNPGSARLREAQAAGLVLTGRDPQARAFIDGYAAWKPGDAGSAGSAASMGVPGSAGSPITAEAATLFNAVVLGRAERLPALLDAALSSGKTAREILDAELIPAIMDVGAKYERREYFLPQLLQSAETMQAGFERLKPLLAASETENAGPTAVMATVEGDIHDIGKNIVCLILRNHGFTVVDLGKDVPAAAIVETARRENAALIGLSALMTTTMVRMADTVKLAAAQCPNTKIIVGGAVVSEAFANSIGAHGCASDAVAAARLATELTKK
ncbi:MAG: homocysteine S-methyltransferase family protein [Desulfovibrionaceae bacterium]|nr:homocysteine S-methyltransferase family protein [Desulfovibrionaceae bacterium]MBF0513551.1 homocysteine S-methyltransferase family protein [Desulfovibrionaceae bacterium]